MSNRKESPIGGRAPAINSRQTNITTGLRITLCCEPHPHLDSWKRELQRSRMEVKHIWPPPTRLSPGMDVLICEYFPEIANLLPWDPGGAKSAFIILLPQNCCFDDDIVVSAAPHCILQRPVREQQVRIAAMVAWSQFRYERRLQDRIARLDENLRSIRDIERAKLIIMTQKNLNEDAAYRHLRQLAMHHQLPIAKLANTIVQSPGQQF